MGENRLAIDWGKARIGIAASYGSTALAFPVETVPAGKQALGRIAALVDEYEAGIVYVGLPLTLAGRRSCSAQWVLDQVESLAAEIGADRIRLVDERLSTASASRNLGDAGRSQKRSRQVIDQAAAVEILQRALDIERATGGTAGESLNLEEL